MEGGCLRGEGDIRGTGRGNARGEGGGFLEREADKKLDELNERLYCCVVSFSTSLFNFFLNMYVWL